MKKPNLQIRPAHLEDLPRVAELERATFGDVVYPEFFFRQALDLWPEWFLLAIDGGEPVGYVLGAPSLENRHAWLLSLAARDSARGKGVGRGLVETLLKSLRDKNVAHVRLTVHPDNSALSLYRSLGFREVEHHAGYFHVNDPRVVMALSL